jgi:senataxin
VANLHLSAGIVNLLSSRKPEHRQWARTQIGFISHRPLCFEEFQESGVGAEVSALLGTTFPGSQAELLSSVQALVSADRLAPDAIQRGLLAGQYTHDAARPDRSVMAFIARQLGTPSDTFPAILELFTSLLRMSPTRHAWAFDTSPELPHTLFSEIKRNSSFDALVADTRPSNPKGKGKEGAEDEGPLGFITPFLLSVLDAQKAKEGSGFSEALAKVMSYCFAEMQHDRIDVQVRAAVAETGFKVRKFRQYAC